MDRIRVEWERAYPGHTDNGFALPIEQVVPGAIINGVPIGYFPAQSLEQAEQAWEWHWIKQR